MAAEYIVSSGNPNVILCERGHPDLRDVHPQHARPGGRAAPPPPDPPAGHRRPEPRDRQALARPADGARRAWPSGADGVMVEVHPRPGRGAVGRASSRSRSTSSPTSWPPSSPSTRRSAALHGDPVAVGCRPQGRRSEQALNGAIDRRPETDPAENEAAVVRPAARLRGEPGLPGDKSISHRALLLAALAEGDSRIDGRGRWRRRPLDRGRSSSGSGLGRAGSAERRAHASTTASYRPASTGSSEADGVLDCGNSGTSLRLAAGILAGLTRPHVLDGDSSLRRPPGRSYHRTAALDGRGAPCPPERFPSAIDRGRPYPAPGDRPSTTRPERPGEVGDPAGGPPRRRPDDGPRSGRDAGSHRADAAGARGAGGARRRAAGPESPGRSREGYACGGRRTGPGGCVRGRVLAGRRRDPPGRRADAARRRREPDPPGGHRPARARWAPGSTNARATAAATTGVGEPMADLAVRSSALAAIELGPAEVAAAIDEIPVLCLAATPGARARRRSAARASCATRSRTGSPGIAAGLRALGARVEVDGDDLASRARPPLRGAATDSLDDHRLAMTFAIAGLVAARPRPRSRGPAAPRSRIPASSTSSKGCGHDQARRPHRPSGGPFAVGRDAAGRLRRARHRRRPTSCGIARRSSWPTRSASSAATTSWAPTSRSRTRSGSSRWSTG